MLTAVLLLSVAVNLWSCNNDDDEKLSSQFIIEARSYSLGQGFYTSDAESNDQGTVLWTVTIASPLKAPKEHRISLGLYTPADNIQEGTYTFDAANTQKSLTLHTADIVVNAEPGAINSGQAYQNVSAGTITIRRPYENADACIMTLDLIIDNELVKGYYEGQLSPVL